MTPRELSVALSQAQASYIVERSKLQEKYAWHAQDARLTAFMKCTNVVMSALTSTIFVDHHLTQEDWWKKHGSPGMTEASIQIVIDEFWMFQRIGLLHGLFYAVESSFRNYASALKLELTRGAGFGEIYPKVLETTSLEKFLPFLDLFRLSRNLMHTGGLYDPPSGRNREITFEGETYLFEVGKPCRFLDERLVVRFVLTAKDLLLAVVQAPPLAELHHVKEPIGTQPE